MADTVRGWAAGTNFPQPGLAPQFQPRFGELVVSRCDVDGQANTQRGTAGMLGCGENRRTSMEPG